MGFLKNLFPKHTLMGKLMGSSRERGTGVQGALGSLLKSKKKRVTATTPKSEVIKILDESVRDKNTSSSNRLEAISEVTVPGDSLAVLNAKNAIEDKKIDWGFNIGSGSDGTPNKTLLMVAGIVVLLLILRK